MNQFDTTLEQFDLVCREYAALMCMAEQIKYDGLNYGYIREYMHFGVHQNTLEVDLYGWRLDVSGLDVTDDWDVDKWEAEMLRLPFKNKAEFKRAYRIARLVTRLEVKHEYCH